MLELGELGLRDILHNFFAGPTAQPQSGGTPEPPIDTAVLLLVFNRPDTTARVFKAIRAARPKRLYVAADGPRADRPGESVRCEQVRAIATQVDWPCELHTIFRERNLGCKQGVAQGISWFFDQEEEGIVLEDDVLPLPSFFPYCEEMLERYRHDARVAMISGCNHIAHLHRVPESYYFSMLNHIWGWASWRRAWATYDVTMAAWPSWDASGGLLRWLDGERCVARYWRWQFDRTWRGKVDTWDYQWTFSCWFTGGLTALPAHNLTLNLGFGPDATHTVNSAPDFVRLSPPRELALPLVHPADVAADRVAEGLIQRHVLGLTHWRCLRRTVKSTLKALVSRRSHAEAKR